MFLRTCGGSEAQVTSVPDFTRLFWSLCLSCTPAERGQSPKPLWPLMVPLVEKEQSSTQGNSSVRREAMESQHGENKITSNGGWGGDYKEERNK